MEEFSKAIELDPEYARAYAALALSYSHDILREWEITDKESLLKASVLVDKAIQMDATIAVAIAIVLFMAGERSIIFHRM